MWCWSALFGLLVLVLLDFISGIQLGTNTRVSTLIQLSIMDIFVPLPFLYDFFFCTQLPLFPRPPSTHWNLSNLRWQAIKQHRFPKIFFGEGQKISPIISINLYGAFQTTRDYRISLGWQLHH